MKNLYLKRTKFFGLFSVLFLCAQLLSAQTLIQWNGSVSSAHTEPANWTPEGTMPGNDIKVGNSSTYDNPLIVTGSEDLEIHDIDWWMAGETIDNGDGTYTEIEPGVLTINMDEGATFRIGASDSDYTAGILRVIGGNFHYNANKNYYADSNSSEMYFDCDTVTFKHWLGLGDRNGTKGGYMEVTGSTLLRCNYLDRIPVALGRVHVYIDDDAEIRILAQGDNTAWIQERIDSGSIGTSAERDVVVVYDAINDNTVINTRLKSAFEIEPIDRQVLIAGQAGATVSVVENDGYASMTGGTEWVYGTVDGTFDTSFDPVQTGSSIDPVFANSGTFFMALKGIDGDGATHFTNSVEFFVASNKAIISPSATQNIRLGEAAAMLTVTETPAATSREWKWTDTPGENYRSFDPAITGAEFSADFTEVGTYFVVCESVIEGNTETSVEVQFNILSASATSANLTWLGVSDDAQDIFNWDPASHIRWNNLAISDITVPFMPVLRSAGNDTINKINFSDGAVFTVSKPSLNDTLNLRGGDHYVSGGKLVIEGGVFTKTGNFFRLAGNNDSVVVKNDAKAIFENQVILGNSNTPTSGGKFIVQDNAEITYMENVWRVGTTVEGISEWHMSGNAKLIFTGDRRGTISTWINGVYDDEAEAYTSYPKFFTPDGTVPYMVYDPNNEVAEDGATIVTVRDLSAFGVEQTKTQVVGRGQATNALTLINAGAYSSFEWKYSTSTVGPWESFDTPVTGASASVSFPDAGTYYVVCVGDGVDVTTNAVPVQVVDVSVTPAADQYIAIDADGNTLTVTLPEGATGVQWKYSTVSGGPYQEFLPQELNATYLPWGDEYTGHHFIVYEATVTDDDGQQVTVYSNEVKIFVGTTDIGDLEAASFNVYPNPSDGDFTVELDNEAEQVITVYNTVGTVISSQVVYGGGMVSLSIEDAGIYLIKVTNGDATQVKRVTVK